MDFKKGTPPTKKVKKIKSSGQQQQQEDCEIDLVGISMRAHEETTQW
jgi:hypothetical protein